METNMKQTFYDGGVDIEYNKLCNACLSCDGKLVDIFAMEESDNFITMYQTCTTINVSQKYLILLEISCCF